MWVSGSISANDWNYQCTKQGMRFVVSRLRVTYRFKAATRHPSPVTRHPHPHPKNKSIEFFNNFLRNNLRRAKVVLYNSIHTTPPEVETTGILGSCLSSGTVIGGRHHRYLALNEKLIYHDLCSASAHEQLAMPS